MVVVVWYKPPLLRYLSGFREELLAEGKQRGPAHEETACEQYATDTERAQTLHLSIPAGKAVRRGLEGPADCCQRHDVAHEVGEAVDGVGDECWQALVDVRINAPSHLTLTIEDVASEALADSHAQVDVEANLGNAHAGVILVLGQEEGVVVVMVVMTGVASFLRGARHGGRGKEWFAVDGRRPVAERRCMRRDGEVLGTFGRRLRAQDAQFGAAGRRFVGVT